MTAYERLCAARDQNRPTAIEYIRRMFGESFLELHGDRRYGDDKAVLAGIASLNGMPLTVIALEKGRNVKERVARNFGSAHPEGYRKALRLMKQAEKFNRPVVCFVDTAGAYCGLGAEERGQGSAIATNLVEMMGLKVPIISILIGEGGSGGALALAVADEVWMLENAVYSVLSPEGAASIVYKDAGQVERAAEALHITAEDLAGFGIVERVIDESQGFDTVYHNLKELLTATLDARCGMDVAQLLEERYKRFRKFGGLME